MGEPPSRLQEDDLLMEEEELEGDESVPPQLPAASGPAGAPPAAAVSPSSAVTPTAVTVASPAVTGGASATAPVPAVPDRIPLPPTAGGLPPLPPVPRVSVESAVPANSALAGTREPAPSPTPVSGSAGDAMSFASTAARPVPASAIPGVVDRPSSMMVDRSGDAPVGGRGLLLPPRPLGIPPTTGTTASSPSPAAAAGSPTGARLPGPATEAPLTRRAVAPAGTATAWMPVPETQVVPLADLVAQVRLLPLPVPVGEGGTLEVGPVPDESDSSGVSPSGPSYGVSRVELDPSWRSELERVIARPSDVRVEHHWILAQPPERHELLWKTRVARAIAPVIPPRYGVCDLVAPSLPGEGDYPTAARAVAATCAPVRFEYPVPGTQRLPGLDYYAGEPPYLKVVPPFPPMSGMKTAASWRRNHGIIADTMRTDITSALQTGNGLAPPFTLLRPEGWQAGWETAPTFRFDTGPCLRYYGSVPRPSQVAGGPPPAVP
ncbi:hypothetical protein MMPV_001347 [Pyropia vietnamensis]